MNCTPPLILASVALLMSVPAISQDADASSIPVRGVAVSGADLTEDSCEVLATTTGQSPALREVPGLHVLGRVESDPLVIQSTPDVKISGVMCWRSEAKLAANDYLVPHVTGIPLYIKTDTGTESADRTIALEKVNGSFRVRLLSGPHLTPDERSEMVQAMTLYNERVGGARTLSETRVKGSP
jgi:hypothetical protein